MEEEKWCLFVTLCPTFVLPPYFSSHHLGKKSQSRREKHKCRLCPYLMKLGNIWKSKPQIGSATNDSKDQSLDDDNCKSQRHTGTELAEHSEWAHLEVQKKHNLVCNKENRVYGLQTWASLKQVWCLCSRICKVDQEIKQTTTLQQVISGSRRKPLHC